MWAALSDEREGLSFTIAAGSRQRSHSPIRVQWNSRPYFTAWDSRFSFSSPPTTRRAATVEVFDPASTRAWFQLGWNSRCIVFVGSNRKHLFLHDPNNASIVAYSLPRERVLPSRFLAITSPFRLSGVISQFILIFSTFVFFFFFFFFYSCWSIGHPWNASFHLSFLI
jgi:hypothetical protein